MQQDKFRQDNRPALVRLKKFRLCIFITFKYWLKLSCTLSTRSGPGIDKVFIVNEKMIKISIERIEQAIFLIRGQKVLLDADLAQLYGVETKVLNKAVKRNLDRFPEDFMFQLTAEESKNLRFQIGTSKKQRGGRRYLPYAFTEQGVAMLSGVLNSPRAVKVNVEIMRAFVRLRQLLASHTDLARKLTALEQKYDEQFKVVFDAIRALMAPPEKPPKKIGFEVKEKEADYGPRGPKRKRKTS